MQMESVSRCYNLLWLGMLLMCVVFCVMRVQAQKCSCEKYRGCDWSFKKEDILRKRAIYKENLAVGRRSKISSSYNVTSAISGPACLAVDGSRNTSYFPLNHAEKPNCVLSGKGDAAPYWEVDLNETRPINRIDVYWKSDTQEESEGIILQVNRKQCMQFKKPITNPSEVECNMTGSTIRISKSSPKMGDTSFLGICEVEVWVCFPGFFGKYCNVTCTKDCENNVPCDGVSGECIKVTVQAPEECTLPIKAAIIAGLSVPLGLIIFIIFRLSGSSNKEPTTETKKPGEEKVEEEGEGGEGGEEGEKEEGEEGEEAVEEEIASEEEPAPE